MKKWGQKPKINIQKNDDIFYDETVSSSNVVLLEPMNKFHNEVKKILLKGSYSIRKQVSNRNNNSSLIDFSVATQKIFSPAT